MSHVAAKKTRPGEPQIVDLRAVRMAAEALGLLCEERREYRTWVTDHGEPYGDYPVPQGVKPEDVGRNAVLVLAIPPEKAAAMARNNCGVMPYELAIAPDPNNPGAYVPMYDFFNGGQGLDEYIGAPAGVDPVTGDIEQLAPKLMMHYRMACDKISAKEAGDEIRFEEQPDGSWVSITECDESRLHA